MDYVHTDGGRADAGFRGVTGDCVTRALSIATGIPYGEMYRTLGELAKARGEKTPRNGVTRKVYEPYLRSQGWVWWRRGAFPTRGCSISSAPRMRRKNSSAMSRTLGHGTFQMIAVPAFGWTL